ncbi:hypothetical protein VARIO8X_50057 [Burkholderiales bacterium 8X]|nr:hypothetical protein VARIO8X_50057 [Burkholderiales bacterium 8X]
MPIRELLPAGDRALARSLGMLKAAALLLTPLVTVGLFVAFGWPVLVFFGVFLVLVLVSSREVGTFDPREGERDYSVTTRFTRF